MDQTTQQNAAMVEESTAASHALAQEAQELARLVSHFQLPRAASAAPVRAPRPTPAKADRAPSAPKAANPVRQQQERLAAFAAKPARRVGLTQSAPTKVESWEEF